MIKPPLEVGAAARLSTAFRLRDVVCVGLEAKHLTTEDPPPNFSLGWDAPTASVVWELEAGSLKVILPFSIFIHAGQNGDTEKNIRLAEISVAMRLEYEANKGATWSEADLPHYVGITAYLHAWPYFRADVQCLSAKLGYPPLVLPVIVSGHAANHVTVTRLGEVRNPSPLPRKPRLKRKASR